MTQPLNNRQDTLLEDDDFLDNIDEEDYIFIMDSQGNLKTVLLPEDYNINDLPDNIQKALEFFGVNKLENRTLH
jgi:hypothetical protein